MPLRDGGAWRPFHTFSENLLLTDFLREMNEAFQREPETSMTHAVEFLNLNLISNRGSEYYPFLSYQHERKRPVICMAVSTSAVARLLGDDRVSASSVAVGQVRFLHGKLPSL